MDGYAERAINTLDDILIYCVISLKGNWDTHIPLIEFAYNNSYLYNIHISPYETLYVCRYKSLLY